MPIVETSARIELPLNIEKEISHTYQTSYNNKVLIYFPKTTITIKFPPNIKSVNNLSDKLSSISFANTQIQDFNCNLPSSLNNCSSVFYNCTSLNSLADDFTIGTSVTNCYGMFQYCSSLTNLPNNFNIGNSVTDCSYMFHNCDSLTSLPTNFTIGTSVTNCYGMFYYCKSLTSLPTNFTIGNSVTDCGWMFSNCESLTNLPNNFNIGNSVTDCSYMFSYCNKLEGTISQDLINKALNVSKHNNMFTGCTKLTNYSELVSKGLA